MIDFLKDFVWFSPALGVWLVWTYCAIKSFVTNDHSSDADVTWVFFHLIVVTSLGVIIGILRLIG